MLHPSDEVYEEAPPNGCQKPPMAANGAQVLFFWGAGTDPKGQGGAIFLGVVFFPLGAFGDFVFPLVLVI